MNHLKNMKYDDLKIEMDEMPPLKDMIVKDYPDLIKTSILSTVNHSDSVFKVQLS